MKRAGIIIILLMLFVVLGFGEDSLYSAKEAYQKGKISTAYLQIKKAVDSGDDRLDTYLYAGIIYSDYGKTEEAIEVLFLGLQKYPKNEKLLTIAGRNYLRLEKYIEAYGILKIALSTGNKDSRVREYIADACVGMGNFDDAIFYYNKAISLNPNDSWVYIKLGSIQKRLGKTDEAKESFTTALEKAQEQNIKLLYQLAEHELSFFINKDK